MTRPPWDGVSHITTTARVVGLVSALLLTRLSKGAMELSEKLPEEAEPHDHLVHLYGRDHHALVTNVGRFFRVGLRRGDSLLAIATLEHCDGFARELHREPEYQPA
ncbi:MAG TPA: hypothetical protein VFB89_03665, partial [Gemmatimonadales bacterium]|nr:hypothetical protein [Gemmatimonadales bacterium]